MNAERHARLWYVFAPDTTMFLERVSALRPYWAASSVQGMAFPTRADAVAMIAQVKGEFPKAPRMWAVSIGQPARS